MTFRSHFAVYQNFNIAQVLLVANMTLDTTLQANALVSSAAAYTEKRLPGDCKETASV